MACSSRTKSSISVDLFSLPPLPDTRKQSMMICKIPNDFFLPDRKNTQLSKIVNTWTFNRLTPNGNEGVGIQLDYLECAYGTRYYVIDKVNGDINAIHNVSLKLTEFKGCYSPFDLDNLEAKVCKLALGDKDEEDVFESQDAPQRRYSNPNQRAQNMEEYEGMGFNENNYSPIPLVGGVASRNSRPTSTPKPTEEIHLNISDPTHNRGKVKRVNSFDTIQEQTDTEAKQSKGGLVKSLDTRGHPQPGTSNQVESCRPQINCTTCRGHDHLRKDCHEDVFCNRCRTRSHTTEMCRVPTQPATGNTICIYCGSINHTSGRCHNKPNNNREEPQSTPRDLREQRPRINHSRMGQPQVSHHQTRFNEGLNRQYSPNYTNPYQSTLGSIPGQDLSATLMELANIQSRSLEMMAASQRSQQEAFQEQMRASRYKAKDSMFTAIKIFDGTNRQAFEDWIDEVDQACRASNRGFRTELFKKSTGAVRQVILSCDEFSDDELVAKLRSCFFHAPMMNEAREEL